jgi:hypothetical protein
VCWWCWSGGKGKGCVGGVGVVAKGRMCVGGVGKVAKGRGCVGGVGQVAKGRGVLVVLERWQRWSVCVCSKTVSENAVFLNPRLSLAFLLSVV